MTQPQPQQRPPEHWIVTREEVEERLAHWREQKANVWREGERFRERWEAMVDGNIRFYETWLELFDE